MNKSFKRFKSKLTKVSLIAVVGVVTCSLAYGSSVQNGAIVDKEFSSLEDGRDSIIEDKVDPEGYIKIIKAKSVFNKKENMICLEWDSEKKEGKYKVYKLATEEDLDESDKEYIKEINEKKFILLKEVQECELKVENLCKPKAPKVNMPKEYENELEVTIECKESSLMQSYYVESIDENGNVVEKTEEIKVDLDNSIKGYSYVINTKEEDEPDEKIDTKKSMIKIELDNSKKYLHIRAIDVNGIAGESVTIELPKTESNGKNGQIKKIVRTNKINHNIKPSDWTNKDVDINVHAISKKGFKQITYPDGTIEDLTTSRLHLNGGEGRDDFKNVAPTKDGGFIAVGESNSSTFNDEKLSLAGGMDAIIVKYDEGGNVEWVKTWGKVGGDAFHGVTEVVKNNKVVGYVAVGESNTENTYNSVVVRFDVNGNKIWEDIIPGVAVDEVLWDVIQDSAGRIVTAGWHTSNVKDDRDGIIRIYGLDSPQAIKVVTSPYDIPSENKWFSEGYDAIKEVSDGYVVVGSSREWNTSSRIYEPRVGRIVKFDKELNVVWNKSFKGAYNLDKEMDFDNVVLTSDGNIVVVGDGSVDKGEDILEEAKGGRDGFIIKFNIKDGSVIWSKRFGGSGEEQMYGIQERSNGDLVVIGKTSSSDKDFSGTIKEPNEMKLDDVFIMTFAGDTGEKVGAVTRIGGKGNDIGWAIRTLNDGRLVSVGTTTSGQSQGNDAFVCFIKGTTDINSKYTVSENGTYKFKFTDVSNTIHDYSVTVSNIDKESPQIVLSGNINNGTYKINSQIRDNIGIAVQKWSEGEQDVDYFKEKGTVFTGDEIEADAKNTYTVYARDLAGNESREILHYRVDDVVGINTDYAITSSNVTGLDGSKVSSLLRGESYRYGFDVSNLNGTPFIETFGGSKYEHIYHTIVHDGNYISVGHTASTNYDFSGLSKGMDDAFIVKHNNKGEIVWKKILGGSGEDYAMSVIAVENGYIVVGYTTSTNGDFAGVQSGGFSNAYIMEVDFNGNKKWSNAIYLSDWDHINSVVQRDDDGYILVGTTQSHPNYSLSNTNDIVVIGISSKGKTEYVKYIGGDKKDVAEKIVNNEDGTYTIIGHTHSTSGLGVHKGGEDGVLIKIDEKGNVLKVKNFGGAGNDHFRGIYRMDNGDMVVVGYTESNNKDLTGVKSTLDRDGLVVLVDKNFNTKWVKALGGSKNEWLLAVYADDTGIMTSGFGGSNDGVFAGLHKGGEDAIVARFSLDGEFEWARNFGGSGEERLRTMAQTPEGGYIIGGDTTSKDGDLVGIVNRGAQDALLVKFNPDGTFGTLKSDNEISTIDYKIEANTSGVKTLIKEGSYKNQIVNPGETITKTVDFKVPQTSVSEILITTELRDSQDSNLSNNKIETIVPLVPLVETDFALKNDKILDENGVKKEEVEVGLEYKYNFDVSNIDTTPFIKTFGGSGNEHFEKHIITSDGGIVAVGRTSSNDKDLSGLNKGGNDALIVKYDQYGNVQWRDSYGGSGNDMFYQAMELSDGSIVAVGQKSGKDNLIVKYTKDGKFIWEKVYRDSQLSSTRVTNAIVDEDDNMYLIDTGYSGGTYGADPSYSKWDKNGNRIWRKFLNQNGDSGTTTLYGIDLANNGDLFLTGKYAGKNGNFNALPNYGGTEAFVAKVSSDNGAIKWITGISGSDHDDARQAVEDEDGNVIVIGRTVSGDGHFNGLKKPLKNGNYASGSLASDEYYKKQDGFVARLSSTGKLQKVKMIGGGGYDNLRYLSKMKDGYFLISGDTASTDGDFKGREVMDSGYTDTVWMKMDKNFNIKWISILGGNNDDATQSGIELPDGSIVVAGETKSTNGDFKGLNKGGQDAFIARLNADGELVMYPHDEEISSIKYNFTWSDGVTNYPVKSGSLNNINVPVGKTVNKAIEFEVPRDSRIKTMTLSAEIFDGHDANNKNNMVTKTVNVRINRDYLFEGYNVKEKGKSKLSGTLRKDTEYELNLKLKNSYIGVDNSRQKLFGKVKTGEKSTYIPKIDSLKYKIVSTDGLNPQDVNSITLNNVKGTVLAKGEKKDISIPDQSSVWEKIIFKTEDDEHMSEVIFVAEIESIDDGDASNNRFVVKLPIVNKEEPEISINGVTIYPGGGEDNGKLMIGNEMNVKVVLGSSTLKTHDVDVKLYIEDGSKRVQMDKKAFGVSREYPGVVYFKYKPENIGSIKVVAEIDTVYGEESFGPVYSYVEKSKEPKQYAEASEKSEDKYDISADVITYLKTQKRDKNVIKTRTCIDKKKCQQDFNGNLVCPGHEYWDWGDWYNAYVPVKSTKLNGFKEAYEIKKVLFRSKETEKMRDHNLKEINDDGTVDLMDEESSKFAYIKAGYGFELKVETEYKNNLPELMKKASVANIAPNNTNWSQYKIIQHNQSSIPFVYYSEKLKGIDKLILSNNGVVSFTVPSLDDIIMENPDQLYLKTPDNKYIMVDEGYGGVYGDDVSTSLEVVNTSSKGVTGNSYYDTKIIEFKKPSGNALARRNYYISDQLRDGKHKIKIFNRYSGYGATNDNKLHVNNDFDIIIKGGKYDDIVDMAQ